MKYSLPIAKVIPKYYYNPIARRRMKIIDTVIALIFIAIAIFCLLNYNYFKASVSTSVLFSGYIGMFLFAVILDSVPQVVSPFMIIAVALASGFNFNLVLIMVLAGSIIGNLLGFYIGRKYGWRLVLPLLSEKNLDKLFKFSEKQGKLILIVSHFTPVLYISMIFGALNIRKSDFIVYGILIRMINFALGAYALQYGLINYNPLV